MAARELKYSGSDNNIKVLDTYEGYNPKGIDD